MSSKKKSKTKVSQNDLRRMMNDMRNKKTPGTNGQTVNTQRFTTKKEARTSLANPEVYRTVLKDKRKLQALVSESKKETSNSLKRSAENEIDTNTTTDNEKPLKAKVAKIEKKINEEEKLKNKKSGGLLIGDYDSDSEEEEIKEEKTEKMETEPTKNEEKVKDSTLPEGFFDDPEIDAKFRGVETPADAMDREWEEFQKVMQHETGHSEQIVEVEQEAGNIDRQIEEIDEQIVCYSRVEKLNIARDEIKEKVKKKPVESVDSDDETVSDELDESSLDWREKDAFI